MTGLLFIPILKASRRFATMAIHPTANGRQNRRSWFSLCLFIASAAYLYQVRTSWLPLVPAWVSDSLAGAPASLLSIIASTNSASHPSVSSPIGNQQTTGSKADPRSVAVAAGTYHAYLILANAETAKMHAAYDRIGAQYKPYGEALRYTEKLDNQTKANEANAGITRQIATLAIESFAMDESYIKARTEGSLFRVREAFQHYERDWSADGKAERDVVFGPILQVLRDEVEEGQRRGVKVLVPGSGLGRLAWEISELGE